jgi:hypothetical protein
MVLRPPASRVNRPDSFGGGPRLRIPGRRLVNPAAGGGWQTAFLVELGRNGSQSPAARLPAGFFSRARGCAEVVEHRVSEELFDQEMINATTPITARATAKAMAMPPTRPLMSSLYSYVMLMGYLLSPSTLSTAHRRLADGPACGLPSAARVGGPDTSITVQRPRRTMSTTATMMTMTMTVPMPMDMDASSKMSGFPPAPT